MSIRVQSDNYSKKLCQIQSFVFELCCDLLTLTATLDALASFKRKHGHSRLHSNLMVRSVLWHSWRPQWNRQYEALETHVLRHCWHSQLIINYNMWSACMHLLDFCLYALCKSGDSAHLCSVRWNMRHSNWTLIQENVTRRLWLCDPGVFA